MRSTMLITALASMSLAGCLDFDLGGDPMNGSPWSTNSPENEVFELQSNGDLITSGIGLASDAPVGTVGMREVTCDVDMLVGSVNTDYDLSDDADETVHDGHDQGGRIVTLAVTGSGVHLIQPEEGTEQNIPLAGVRKARLLQNRGFVALRAYDGACTVEWRDLLSPRIAELPFEMCADGAGLAIDRTTGTAWVANGEVLSATPSGYQSHALEGDMVAWDEARGLLYLASRAGDRVQAVDSQGTVLWEAATVDPILELTDMGSRGQVLVVTDGADGHRLMVLDGETGLELSDLPTQLLVSDVAVADGGDWAAVGFTSHVAFYRLR